MRRAAHDNSSNANFVPKDAFDTASVMGSSTSTRTGGCSFLGEGGVGATGAAGAATTRVYGGGTGSVSQIGNSQDEAAISAREAAAVSMTSRASMPEKIVLYSPTGEPMREISFLSECVFDVPSLAKTYDELLAAPDLAQRISAPSLGLQPAGHPASDDDGTYAGATRMDELRAAIHEAIFGYALARRTGASLEGLQQDFLAVEQITDASHPLRLERPNDEPAVTVVYNGPEISTPQGDDPRILGALFGAICQIERTDRDFLLLPSGASESDGSAVPNGSLPMEDARRAVPHIESMLAYQPRSSNAPQTAASGAAAGGAAATAGTALPSISHVAILQHGKYVLDVSERCSPSAFIAHFETVWGPLHRQALGCPKVLVSAVRRSDEQSEQQPQLGAAGHIPLVGSQAAVATYGQYRGPNVRWHAVTVDGQLPFLVFSTIPGVPLKPGTELLCDKGPAWFRQHSRLCWPALFAELVKSKGGTGPGVQTPLPRLLLSELPRRLVCAECGEACHKRDRFHSCDACKLHFHQSCLQSRKATGATKSFCSACVGIAEKVLGIAATDDHPSTPVSPLSPDTPTTDAASALIRGDEPPFALLKPCTACATAHSGLNVNVQCRLVARHAEPEAPAPDTPANRLQTLSNSLAIAVGGIVAAEERNAALAQKATDVQASALYPDMSESDLQEAVEQWKIARLRARARGSAPAVASLLVPHIPLMEPQAAEAATLTVYRARNTAPLHAAATSADDEDSDAAHYSDEDDDDDEEEDGSALAESDDGGPTSRRHRRSRPAMSHVSIEGGPQSVARDLLGDDFEPPAGVAVMIEGNSSITDANNKAKDLRPWPRGVSWNGKRLTWSVRFWAPGGLRLLSTSLPARKHGGVLEAFRKAVTLRTRSYGYVLARVAGETLAECGNLPAAVWESNRWRVTAPDGSSETFEAQAEQEVRSALRQAFHWLRERGDTAALALDPAAVDAVVNKPRPAPIPEGPAHEMAVGTNSAVLARSKRSRMADDFDVLPPPGEVQPCGQNLSLPSPYYSQDLAVMTAEMEAEVRQLPENDKIKWYRQKRGFNASIYGQSKWFSAYSRGVHNAYTMAVAWLERRKAEAASMASGRPIATPAYHEEVPRCSSGGSTAHGRRTRSNRLDYRNSPRENNEYYDSGYTRSSIERSKRPMVPRPERPLNPGVRQMMEIADEVQHNGRWDSDDSTPDANDQARRLPKISNICWVPQKQAFSVFYTKDPAHSSKTTKAFNPQYYGGVKRSFRQALLFAFAMQLRMHPSWRSRFSGDEEQPVSQSETKPEAKGDNSMGDEDYRASRTCTP